MKDRKSMLEDMLKDRVSCGITLLSSNKDTFNFGCDGCGECCTKDTVDSIMLTPFDLYNIAKTTGENIMDVIKENTDVYIGDTSHFIVARMKAKNGVCPYLDNKKCSVHDMKPSACRLFPLGRAIDTEKNEMFYFLQNVNCGTKDEIHTVDEWIPNKEDYELMLNKQNDLLTTLRESLNLEELRRSSSPKILKVLNALYELIFRVYYCNYSTETHEDFFEQLDSNIEILKGGICATKDMLRMIENEEI